MGLPLFLLFLKLALLWESVKAQKCGVLQDSSHIISNCQPTLEGFQELSPIERSLHIPPLQLGETSQLDFSTPELGEIENHPNLPETPLTQSSFDFEADKNKLRGLKQTKTCCNFLQFGSQDFSGRQCMCRLLQSSKDKQLLELLKSVSDPDFLNAACGHSFDIATSLDTCSTPAVIDERLDQDTFGGSCKHKLLELKNDLCREPAGPRCCSTMAALAEDRECICHLSKRKIAGLTQESFSFFDSLSKPDRFPECASTTHSIRRTREDCLRKLDPSSLPSATVTEGCGDTAQVAFEDTCASVMKKGMEGKLPSFAGRPEFDAFRNLRELKTQIESLNSKDPAKAKAEIERLRKKQFLSQISVTIEDLTKPFDEEFRAFFLKSPAGEDVNSFLQRLDKLLKKNPSPLLMPDSFACCQNVADVLAEWKCTCLLEKRDPSLKISNRTLDFVDSIRPRFTSVSQHCGVVLDLVTGANSLCDSILNPTPKRDPGTRKECFQILSGAVKCKEVRLQN